MQSLATSLRGVLSQPQAAATAAAAAAVTTTNSVNQANISTRAGAQQQGHVSGQGGIIGAAFLHDPMLAMLTASGNQSSSTPSKRLAAARTQVAVALVAPQQSVNVGSIARVMAALGHSDLYISPTGDGGVDSLVPGDILVEFSTAYGTNEAHDGSIVGSTRADPAADEKGQEDSTSSQQSLGQTQSQSEQAKPKYVAANITIAPNLSPFANLSPRQLLRIKPGSKPQTWMNLPEGRIIRFIDRPESESIDALYAELKGQTSSLSSVGFPSTASCILSFIPDTYRDRLSFMLVDKLGVHIAATSPHGLAWSPHNELIVSVPMSILIDELGLEIDYFTEQGVYTQITSDLARKKALDAPRDLLQACSSVNSQGELCVDYVFRVVRAFLPVYQGPPQAQFHNNLYEKRLKRRWVAYRPGCDLLNPDVPGGIQAAAQSEDVKQSLDGEQSEGACHSKAERIDPELDPEIRQLQAAPEEVALKPGDLARLHPLVSITGMSYSTATKLGIPVLDNAKLFYRLEDLMGQFDVVVGTSAFSKSRMIQSNSLRAAVVKPWQLNWHSLGSRKDEGEEEVENDEEFEELIVGDDKKRRRKPRILVVFGRETTGLTNSELDLCDYLITLPGPMPVSLKDVDPAAAVSLAIQKKQAAKKSVDEPAVEENGPTDGPDGKSPKVMGGTTNFSLNLSQAVSQVLYEIARQDAVHAVDGRRTCKRLPTLLAPAQQCNGGLSSTEPNLVAPETKDPEDAVAATSNAYTGGIVATTPQARAALWKTCESWMHEMDPRFLLSNPPDLTKAPLDFERSPIFGQESEQAPDEGQALDVEGVSTEARGTSTAVRARLKPASKGQPAVRMLEHAAQLKTAIRRVAQRADLDGRDLHMLMKLSKWTAKQMRAQHEAIAKLRKRVEELEAENATLNRQLGAAGDLSTTGKQE